jgi:mycothiol synthase
VDVTETPEGFELRAPSVDDAVALADLFNEVTIAEIGLPWTTADEMHDELTSPGRDPHLDDALVTADEGRIVGFLQFYASGDPLQVAMLVLVRPDLFGKGLSAWLLRLGEERARARASVQPPGSGAILRASRFAENEPAGSLFASFGYRYARTFWMMRIERAGAVRPPDLPAGIAIRNFEPARDERRVHAALSEAFADHWGWPFPPFEEWRHHEIEGEGAEFDPGLWFVAVERDEVVGAACCRARIPRAKDTGSVSDLAVRRPWRRRGIALALLLTAFAEFRRRGLPRVELSVDADSPTGATRLYERAGMHVAYSWEHWEKRLET